MGLSWNSSIKFNLWKSVQCSRSYDFSETAEQLTALQISSSNLLDRTPYRIVMGLF